MNISSGLSEINLQSLSGGPSKSQKIFTWPAYQQKKVDVIEPVKNRTPHEPFYIKPGSEEKQELLNQLHSKDDFSYNASGKGISRQQIIKPGSFFDAIV